MIPLEQEIILPKVSIGMPVYNGEKYILKALDSLLGQTFTDFELIISDNASTDNTYLICQEYTKNDSRVKLIRQTKNMGAIWNFEFVFKEATGVYFMWAAADDMWAEDWIEKLLNKHTDGVIMSSGKAVVIGSDDEVLFQLFPVSFVNQKLLRLAHFYFYYNQARNMLIYSLFLREPLANNDKFVQGMMINELYSIIIAMQYGWVECDPTTVLFKRFHSDCVSVKESKKMSFFVKLRHAIFPFEMIWDRLFMYQNFDFDIRVLFLCLFPLHLIQMFYISYKNIVIWIIRRTQGLLF